MLRTGKWVLLIVFFNYKNLAVNTNIKKEPSCCLPGSDCCGKTTDTWVVIGCC